MPRVNKQSLRQEFDQFKDKYEHLLNEGKITPEVGTLFQAMIMLFDLLIAVFMEKKTKKNNRNSSKPSSQTGKDQTSTQSGTNGKGKEQNGALSANTRTVETTRVAKVKNCEVI
jgi:transposase